MIGKHSKCHSSGFDYHPNVAFGSETDSSDWVSQRLPSLLPIPPADAQQSAHFLTNCRTGDASAPATVRISGGSLRRGRGSDRNVEKAHDADDKVTEREDCDRSLDTVTSAGDAGNAQEHQSCLRERIFKTQ